MFKAEESPNIDTRWQSLLPPPRYRRSPRAIDQRDSVWFFMVVNTLITFMRSHNFLLSKLFFKKEKFDQKK
jgi:hypothetical protein